MDLSRNATNQQDSSSTATVDTFFAASVHFTELLFDATLKNPAKAVFLSTFHAISPSKEKISVKKRWEREREKGEGQRERTKKKHSYSISTASTVWECLISPDRATDIWLALALCFFHEGMVSLTLVVSTWHRMSVNHMWLFVALIVVTAYDTSLQVHFSLSYRNKNKHL